MLVNVVWRTRENSLHLTNWFHKLRFTLLLSTLTFTIRCLLSLVAERKKIKQWRENKLAPIDNFKSGAAWHDNSCCCSSTLFEYFIWNWFRKLFNLIIGQAAPHKHFTFKSSSSSCFLGRESQIDFSFLFDTAVVRSGL